MLEIGKCDVREFLKGSLISYEMVKYTRSRRNVEADKDSSPKSFVEYTLENPRV